MEDLKAWLDDNPDLLARWAFLKKETKKQGVGCFPSDKNDEVKREYITTFLEIAEKKQGTADQSAPSSDRLITIEREMKKFRKDVDQYLRRVAQSLDEYEESLSQKQPTWMDRVNFAFRYNSSQTEVR